MPKKRSLVEPNLKGLQTTGARGGATKARAKDSPQGRSPRTSRTVSPQKNTGPKVTPDASSKVDSKVNPKVSPKASSKRNADLEQEKTDMLETIKEAYKKLEGFIEAVDKLNECVIF